MTRNAAESPAGRSRRARVDADASGDRRQAAPRRRNADATRARILKADANGDGVVTKEERAAVREKWKEARKERMERRGEDKPAEAPAAP